MDYKSTLLKIDAIESLANQIQVLANEVRKEIEKKNSTTPGRKKISKEFITAALIQRAKARTRDPKAKK